MKGKLSRMCRSGLSMMLALIMMFSLATVAFATEVGVSDIIDTAKNKYEEHADTVAKVKEAAQIAEDFLRNWEVLDGKYAMIVNEENIAKAKEMLEKAKAALEVVVAKAENTELVQEAIAIKNQIDTLLAKVNDINEELADVEGKIAGVQERLNSITAKAEELGADPADIELIKGFDFTRLEAENLATLTSEQIDELTKDVDELKAALERVMELEDEAGELKAEAEQAKADMESLQKQAEDLQDEAEKLMDEIDALKSDLVDLAERVVALTKETLKDLAKIAEVLGRMAEKHYDGAEEYIYKSLAEQGYIAAADKSVDKIISLMGEAKAKVEANTGLTDGFKTELLTAIDNAVAATKAVKSSIANASNLKEALPTLKELTTAMAGSVKTVYDLFQEGTRADLIVAKKAAKEAYALALDVKDTMIDIVKAAIYDATHEAMLVPCKPNYVALGDGSVSGYAALLAKELVKEPGNGRQANLVDLSAQGESVAEAINSGKIAANAGVIAAADVVTLGYGFDGINDYVVDMLTTTNDIDWSEILDEADVQIVDDALEAVRAELAEKLSDEMINLGALDMIMIAIESYAHGYASYLVKYPLIVDAIHDVNADALVVVVGTYNPLKNVVVDIDGHDIALGKYIEKVVDVTGLYNLASAIMMPNCIYVEASDVSNSLNTSAPISIAALAMTLDRGAAAMLPNEAGAAYIKGQIMNALDVDFKAHVWDNGVEIVSKGLLKYSMLYTCTVCGATEIRANDDHHMAFMQGKPGGIFDPDANTTRAEVAMMFYNMMDDETKAENAPTKDVFSDVSKDAEDNWYYDAVMTLYNYGGITGYPDGTFRPNAPITRAEFTAIAVRLSGLEAGGEENFPDVVNDDWFHDYVATSVKYNWVNGYPDGTFKPQKNITRAEAAKVACGMLGRSAVGYDEVYDALVAEGSMKVLNDINGHWAYYWILEATNEHMHTWDN